MTDSTHLDRRAFMGKALGGAVALSGAAELLAAGGASARAPQERPAAAAVNAASPGPGGKPRSGGSLSLATVDTPVNMDPRDAQLYSSMQVYQNIFHKLVNVDADYKIVPGLASSWEQNDEKTWTFDLVDNAVFSNGEPFTADDVAYTVDTMPTHGNASFWSPFKKTEVLGKHKVRFHLAGPYGAVLPTLAAFSDMMNRKAGTTLNPKLQPVGCGPYKMTQWVQGDHITLERYDKYFKPHLPYLDTLTWRSVADDQTMLSGLQSNQYGWVQQVPLQEVTSLDSSSSISHTVAKPYFPDVLLLNCSKPPFNDVRVRQAIAWLVDRKEICEIVWFGQAVPATEAVSPPNPFYSGVDPYKSGPDPEKAKALLKAAGVSNLQLVYAGTPGIPTQVRMGEVLKSQLAKAGIGMSIKNYTSAAWFNQIATKNYDLTITYWSATLDPVHMYQGMVQSGSSFNFSFINSKKIDAALHKFAYTIGEKARKAVYPDLVQAVAEEAPMIFIDNEYQEYWGTPKLGGNEPLPSLEIRAEDMWLAS
jgi:peptide/nickel transport system substrate-binding protein